MKALALSKVSLTVGDLAAMQAFYLDAVGFRVIAPAADEPDQLAAHLGARRMRTVQLARGQQVLELAEFDPAGEAYPSTVGSNDGLFQHCALVTEDIASAYGILNAYPYAPISRPGPQLLPGGIVAFKFRDPEGHPLELIQFPRADPATAEGIDHSAISVADTKRSIAFYTAKLGFTVASRQVNAGSEQEALDDLDGVAVDVVGLSPCQAAPHLELLGYRTPRGRAAPLLRPIDVAATRLVLQVDTLADEPGAAKLPDGTSVLLMHDPDGHALLLWHRQA